jgi:hypothetical protein
MSSIPEEAEVTAEAPAAAPSVPSPPSERKASIDLSAIKTPLGRSSITSARQEKTVASSEPKNMRSTDSAMLDVDEFDVLPPDFETPAFMEAPVVPDAMVGAADAAAPQQAAATAASAVPAAPQGERFLQVDRVDASLLEAAEQWSEGEGPTTTDLEFVLKQAESKATEELAEAGGLAVEAQAVAKATQEELAALAAQARPSEVVEIKKAERRASEALVDATELLATVSTPESAAVAPAAVAPATVAPAAVAPVAEVPAAAVPAAEAPKKERRVSVVDSMLGAVGAAAGAVRRASIGLIGGGGDSPPSPPPPPPPPPPAPASSSAPVSGDIKQQAKQKQEEAQAKLAAAKAAIAAANEKLAKVQKEQQRVKQHRASLTDDEWDKVQVQSAASERVTMACARALCL